MSELMDVAEAVVMPRKTALWEMSFRAFFLLALYSSGALLLLWLLIFSGAIVPPLYFSPLYWHAHEMIYGFAVAVVVGFIFTAAQNWTGSPGIKGAKLQLLVGLWFFARVLMAWPLLPNVVIAALDLAFLPVAGVFLLPYLGRPEQRHNAIFLVLFLLLAIGNLLMHLSAQGVLAGFEQRGIYLGLYVIILMIVVIGGRVIPFFSERAIPGYKKSGPAWLNKVVLVVTLLFVLVSVVAPASTFFAGCAVAAALVNLWRWLTWHHRGVWRLPILGILYLGYFWVIVGFILTAIANTVGTSASATHAFTVGAIGTMIIGMISRVSLGHTGRTITASALTVISYVLITSAAMVRVFSPLFAPNHYLLAVQVAGGLWIVAFVVMCFVYSRILYLPRPDGRPG